MKRLAPLLARYSAPPSQGGAKKPDFDREKLIRDLRGVRDSNRIYFLICAAMQATLFVVGCALVILRPEAMKPTFPTVGAFLAILSYFMPRLWKDKVLSDTLIVLTGSLEPSQTAKVMELILRKLNK
jgi:hypothetical protein